MEANPQDHKPIQAATAYNADLTEEINRTEDELRSLLSRHVVVI